jgi:hypothetical protein
VGGREAWMCVCECGVLNSATPSVCVRFYGKFTATWSFWPHDTAMKLINDSMLDGDCDNIHDLDAEDLIKNF